MWKASSRSSWMRRHAARATANADAPFSVRTMGGGGPRATSTTTALAIASVASAVAVAAALTPQTTRAESFSSSAPGALSSHRGNGAGGGSLSKEHMRLARRFTRRSHQKFHRYVIVGCGTAAHAAIEAIRQSDPQADILVLSDERALSRHASDQARSHASDGDDPNASAATTATEEADGEPPMNDALMETYNEWRRHIAQHLEEDPMENSSFTGSSSQRSASSSATTTLLMRKDTKMHFDVEKNRILLSDGTEIRYEKCLIACSGRPRNFYVLDSDRISYALKDRINLCTTYRDFEQLDSISKRSDVQRVTVVGGGFLGTEVATAIATDPRNAHLKTQLTFVEPSPGSRSLPAYLAKELATRLTEQAGIEVIPDRLVTSVKSEPRGGKKGQDQEQDAVVITALGNGKHKLVSDYVVLASTHTEPNLRLDRQACFEIDDKNGGIVVNAQLEAMAGVFVAGNAASYYDPYIGRRRVDRYDHAVNSGLVAGMNMVSSSSAASAGSPGASPGALPGSPSKMKLYRHQPLFRSNLTGIDVQIEGIGVIDSSLHTVGVWVQKSSKSTGGGASRPTYERGVVYYLKGNKIMGILLWNASDVLESARQLMLSRPEVHENVVDELKEVISLGPDDWLHVVSTTGN